MRHDPGLAASPPVRYILEVERSRCSSFHSPSPVYDIHRSAWKASVLRSSPARLSTPHALGRLVIRAHALLQQGPVVLLGGLHDALLGGTPRGEGGHERTVLAAQDDHVGVRLVEVV